MLNQWSHPYAWRFNFCCWPSLMVSNKRGMITPLFACWFWLQGTQRVWAASHSFWFNGRFWPPTLQTWELHMGSSSFCSGPLAMKSHRTTLAPTPCYLDSLIVENWNRASNKSLWFNACATFWMTVPHLCRAFLLNWWFKIPAGSSSWQDI